MYLPIHNKQQNECRKVWRGNVGFLLKADKDHNHQKTGDDVIALSKQ